MVLHWTTSLEMNSSGAFCIFCVVITLVIAEGAKSGPYCSIPGCGPRHLACGNKGKLAEACGDARIVDMNEHKHLILSLHNELRNKVAGGKSKPLKKAARMAEMQWDDDLAKFAELGAKTCDIKYSACIRTERFHTPSVNKGLFGYTGEKEDYMDDWLIRNRFTNWVKYEPNATMALIKKYPKPVDKHASFFCHVIHERNTHVGCGAVRFTEGGYNRFLLVCQYALSNGAGEPIYKHSKRAGCRCKTGTSSHYHNLCSKKEVYE